MKQHAELPATLLKSSLNPGGYDLAELAGQLIQELEDINENTVPYTETAHAVVRNQKLCIQSLQNLKAIAEVGNTLRLSLSQLTEKA